MDFKERKERAREAKKKGTEKVEAAGPNVEPVEEDGLPSYYPERPLNARKISIIFNNLEKDCSGHDHAKIGTFVDGLKLDASPMAPISRIELGKFIEGFNGAVNATDKEKVMERFLVWAKGSNSGWKKGTKKEYLMYIFTGAGN